MTDALSVTPLNVLTVDRYAPMIAPSVRYLLPRVGSTGSVVAFGGSVGGDPVGVVLATEVTATELEIVWLYVANAARRRGVGRALLHAAEMHARAQACGGIRLAHPVETARAIPIQRLLEACGWTLDTGRLTLGALRADSMSRARWFTRWDAVTLRGVFSWAELRAGERGELISALGSDTSGEHVVSPFDRERDMDPRTSVGLRRGGRVVGWCITHTAGPKALRYSRLGVRSSVRGSGSAFAMVAVAVRHQIDAYGEDSLCLFAASERNAAMMALIRHNLAPHLAWTQTVSAAFKPLLP